MKGAADLAWLVGRWSGCDGDARTLAQWRVAPAGGLLGEGRTIRDGQTVHQEQMRIEVEGVKVFYRFSPEGRTQQDFVLARADDAEAVFENLGSDFPFRIRYQREGDVLSARIENREGTRQMCWEWCLVRDEMD